MDSHCHAGTARMSDVVAHCPIPKKNVALFSKKKVNDNPKSSVI